MGHENDLNRRTLLTSIAGSVGAASVGTGTAIASKPTAEKLSTTDGFFAEIAFHADISRGKLSTPPTVTCRRNLVSLDSDMRACLPAHLSVESGGQLLNSHAGGKVPDATDRKLFREVPIEASVHGHQVAITGSEAPTFGFDWERDELTVSIDESTHVVGKDEQNETRVTIDPGVDELVEITLNVQLHNYGKTKMLSHPTKSVVPLDEKTAGHYRQIANRSAQGARKGVEVTEITDEKVLLVDHTKGGGNE